MSTQKSSDKPVKITTQTVVDMKAKGEKIAMLTAYDFTMAQIIDQAGIEIILVGDSASNVMSGHETTIPMTLEHMIYHTSCVVRGVDRALVIADLPFMSYQVTTKEALISAGRMMKEEWLPAGEMNHAWYIAHLVGWCITLLAVATHLLLGAKVGGIPLLLSMFQWQTQPRDTPKTWLRGIKLNPSRPLLNALEWGILGGLLLGLILPVLYLF